MSYSDSETNSILKYTLSSQIKDHVRDNYDYHLRAEFKTKKRRMSSKKIAFLRTQLKPMMDELKMLEAVSTNNTDQVKLLLEKGVSPNSMDREMRSALHIAVTKGYSEIVQLLLIYGADPNIRDIIENTPLHLAACVPNLSIISMLINAKADVSCLDLHGRNPLQLATSKLQILRRSWKDGSIEMVKLRQELQQVVDLLLSFLIRGIDERMERLNQDKVNVGELQMMKMSLESKPAEQLDDQMAKLLEDIENIQIK